ncbi:MAG: phosphonate monoester hydrolase, partial [Octadecabacter sp.]
RTYSFSELDFGNSSDPNARQRALGTTPSDSCFCILRDDRFNLVEFAADLPPLLFDRQGKWEAENVAEKPEYAQDLMRLTRQLLRHRMRNADHTLSLFEITNDGPKMTKRFT